MRDNKHEPAFPGTETLENMYGDVATREYLGLTKGRSQGWRLTPSEVAQALRSAAASGSYIDEPILRPAN